MEGYVYFIDQYNEMTLISWIYNMMYPTGGPMKLQQIFYKP